MRFLAGGDVAADLQAFRATGGIVYHARLDYDGGGRRLAERATNAPAHRLQIALRMPRQRHVNPAEGLSQAITLALEHRAFLFRPGGAAAQDILFAG